MTLIDFLGFAIYAVLILAVLLAVYLRFIQPHTIHFSPDYTTPCPHRDALNAYKTMRLFKHHRFATPCKPFIPWDSAKVGGGICEDCPFFVSRSTWRHTVKCSCYYKS